MEVHPHSKQWNYMFKIMLQQFSKISFNTVPFADQRNLLATEKSPLGKFLGIFFVKF